MTNYVGRLLETLEVINDARYFIPAMPPGKYDIVNDSNEIT